MSSACRPRRADRQAAAASISCAPTGREAARARPRRACPGAATSVRQQGTRPQRQRRERFVQPRPSPRAGSARARRKGAVAESDLAFRRRRRAARAADRVPRPAATCDRVRPRHGAGFERLAESAPARGALRAGCEESAASRWPFPLGGVRLRAPAPMRAVSNLGSTGSRWISTGLPISSSLSTAMKNSVVGVARNEAEESAVPRPPAPAPPRTTHGASSSRADCLALGSAA